MALIGKKSRTLVSKTNPNQYINDVDDDLQTLFHTMRNVPTVTRGLVAPTSTPTQVGNIYVDTVALKCYMAVGVSASTDWKILN